MSLRAISFFIISMKNSSLLFTAQQNIEPQNTTFNNFSETL